MPKLVRDRVPELLAVEGVRITTEPLDDASFASALRSKLVEEASEVAQSADASALLEELADVYEVLTTLLDLEGLSEADLVERAAAKRATHGGFTLRLWSTSVESGD